MDNTPTAPAASEKITPRQPPTPPSPLLPEPSSPRPARWRAARLTWRWLKIAFVTVFVCWHLFAMLIRNPLDLWKDDIKDWGEKQTWWNKPPFAGSDDEGDKKPVITVGKIYNKVDHLTHAYTMFTGAEQGWSMFTPNLARSAPFLAARIEFTDGTHALVKSWNEPTLVEKEDGHTLFYLRFSYGRQRKLEDNLMSLPDDLKRSESLPMYEAFARWCLRLWQQAHPDDPRVPAHIVLLKRRYQFPEPGHDPWRFEEPKETDFATFDAQGKLVDGKEKSFDAEGKIQ